MNENATELQERCKQIWIAAGAEMRERLNAAIVAHKEAAKACGATEEEETMLLLDSCAGVTVGLVSLLIGMSEPEDRREAAQIFCRGVYQLFLQFESSRQSGGAHAQHPREH